MKNMLSVSIILALGATLAAPGAMAARKKPDPAPSPVEKSLKGGVDRNSSKPVGKGDTEFGFGFDFTNYDAGSNTVTLNANIGKFISDRAEIAIDPTISYNDDGNGGSTFSLVPFVNFKYLFRGANLRNPVVPYVGAGIGLDLSTSSGSTGSSYTVGLFVAPVAGFKAFVSERTSLEYALSFNLGLLEFCDSATCSSGNLTGINNKLLFNIYY